MKLSQMYRAALIATTILILSSGLGMRGFAQTNSPQAVKNIVLVHGARRRAARSYEFWLPSRLIPPTLKMLESRFIRSHSSAGPLYRRLVQERFPVGRHPSCRSRSGLIFWVRMRRKQLHTLDHPLRLVIEEPVLTGLEAGYDRVPCRSRMLGCMLARRTVTASDVPTLRTSTEMEPPTFR
jgi:hypothetical protein